MSVPCLVRAAVGVSLSVLLCGCASLDRDSASAPKPALKPAAAGAGTIDVSLGRFWNWQPYRQRLGQKAAKTPAAGALANRGELGFVVDLGIKVQALPGVGPFAARCSVRFAPVLGEDAWRSPAQALYEASDDLGQAIRDDDWYAMQVAAKATVTELLAIAEERPELAAAMAPFRKRFERIRDGHKIDDWSGRMLLEFVRSTQRGGLAGESDAVWEPEFSLRVQPLWLTPHDRVLRDHFKVQNESAQELRFELEVDVPVDGSEEIVARSGRVSLLVIVGEDEARDPRDAVAALRHQVRAVEVDVFLEPLQDGEPVQGWSAAEFEGACQVLSARFGFEVAYRGDPVLWMQRIRALRELAVAQDREGFRSMWQEDFVSAGARDGHWQDFWLELLKMRTGSRRELIRLDLPKQG